MDIIINKETEGKNIRQLLRGDMGYSSGMLKKLKFSPEGILVNGEFVTVRYVLKEGDVLSIACEDSVDDTSPYITPVKLDIGIAYEDEHLTIVHKPPSMPAHPSLGHKDDTVANALAYRYKDKPYVFRPVNRLDRDTSGLMITANTRLDAFRLHQAMISGNIKKAYIAILDGEFTKESGILTSFMGRCDDSIVKRRICKEEEEGAKRAVTAFRTLYHGNKLSVVLASPITGRTHQLRLHFSSIGFPVTGDSMYGSEHPLIKRHALHSAFTSFPHPETKEILSLYSPIPEDMTTLLEKNIILEIINKLSNETGKLIQMTNED